MTPTKAIRWLLVLALMSEMLISWRIWIPVERLVPEISAFEWLQFSLPTWLNGVLFGVVLIGMAGMLLDKWRDRAFSTVLVLTSILILEDMNRLQPWLFVQLIMLFALNDQKRPHALLYWTLAGIYFWAGFLKLNNHFAEYVFPWLMDEPFGLKGFLEQNHWIAYLAAVIEASVGILLLFKRTRVLGCILGIATHTMVFIALGPGQNVNHVVWPWNLMLMGVLSVILLDRSEPEAYKQLVHFNVRQKVVIVFCAVLPSLQFAGIWDAHLSFSLYSGINTRGIFFHTGMTEPYASSTAFTDSGETRDKYPGVTMTHLTNWYLKETHVPLYPETRYFQRAAQVLCDCTLEPNKSGVAIIVRTNFTSEEITTYLLCDELDELR